MSFPMHALEKSLRSPMKGKMIWFQWACTREPVGTFEFFFPKWNYDELFLLIPPTRDFNIHSTGVCQSTNCKCINVLQRKNVTCFQIASSFRFRGTIKNLPWTNKHKNIRAPSLQTMNSKCNTFILALPPFTEWFKDLPGQGRPNYAGKPAQSK